MVIADTRGEPICNRRAAAVVGACTSARGDLNGDMAPQ